MMAKKAKAAVEAAAEETEPFDPFSEDVIETEPPAVINAAEYDYDGVTVMLSITLTGATDPQPYALNETDVNGISPFLRGELARLVEAGEITILAAPPPPAEDE